MKKLSIIIPIYMTEKYLRRCLDSLVNQSYKNCEIIAVDDASPDMCCKIIQEKYSHEVVLIRHDHNQGVGAARNSGIKCASGDYIAFVDSDDWVDSFVYSLLIESMERCNSEIAICGIKDERDSIISSVPRYHYPFDNAVSADFAIQLLCRTNSQDSYITPMVCNKVFRREILDGISFINGYYEDDAFSFQALQKASKVSFIANSYYHYYQRSGSITHSYSKKHIDDLVNTFAYLLKGIEPLESESIKAYLYSYFLKTLRSSIQRMILAEQNAIVQKKYIIYLHEKLRDSILSRFIVEYMDIEWVKRLIE